jgi:hypothetical protein
MISKGKEASDGKGQRRTRLLHISTIDVALDINDLNIKDWGSGGKCFDMQH